MFSPQPFLFFFFFFFSVSLGFSEDLDLEALLAFKATSDRAGSLSSWLDPSGPCSGSWLGVACDPRTRRVTRLVLENLNLSGSVRPLSRLTQLRLLSLSHNHLSSNRLRVSTWPNLRHLYLSHNEFAGAFPAGISGLRRLRRLDLSHNRFSGEIPMSELNRMSNLLTVRLEGNGFTGDLSSASASSSIEGFNVSANMLSGEIPPWMSVFPVTSFAGNDGLCGEPLPRDCSKIQKHTAPGRVATNRVSNRVLLIIVAVDAAAILAVIAAVWCWCACKRKRLAGTLKETNQEKKKAQYGEERGGGEMVVFDGCKGFSGVDDLLKASAEMLGKGCAGTTYKVTLDGGDAVAVKRVKERTKQREVNGWLKQIGGLRHCNIVSLRAYHHSRDELLLVYDFLSCGSLHSLLHGNRGPGREPWEWSKRLKLASNSAQGLAYLHCSGNGKLHHGHMTPSNIIVDHSSNACIADIGLHRLLPIQLHSAYAAPELVARRRYSKECDVYSFGVILLEILTGKAAGEERVVKWVEQQVVGKEWSCSRVLDIELLGNKEMEDEMRALMEVALLCLAQSPTDRPKMSLVSKMIGDIVGRKDMDGSIRKEQDHSSSSGSGSYSSALSENTIL